MSVPDLDSGPILCVVSFRCSITNFQNVFIVCEDRGGSSLKEKINFPNTLLRALRGGQRQKNSPTWSKRFGCSH